MTGVYIHIPFCKSKCNYCDFNSVTSCNYTVYKDALLNEIKNCTELSTCSIDTVFIGGGTPSLFPHEYIGEILSCFDLSHAKEITLEANPESLSHFQKYKAYGINRLSVGFQAAQDDLLKRLGRIHTRDEFLRVYEKADKHFENINVDLIFGLPGQNLDDWYETLEVVTDLNPSHVSAYSLIIEPGTVFFRDNVMPIDEDLERKMCHMTKQLLHSYEQYEISNFALPRFECKHNIKYWTLDDYLGFGAGAHSFFNKTRWENVSDIKQYISETTSPKRNIIQLSKQMLMEEFMFLGLRMTNGISKSKFKSQFGLPIEHVYGEKINWLANQKLLTVNADNITLTQLGVDVSNYVFTNFML